MWIFKAASCNCGYSEVLFIMLCKLSCGVVCFIFSKMLINLLRQKLGKNKEQRPQQPVGQLLVAYWPKIPRQHTDSWPTDYPQLTGTVNWNYNKIDWPNIILWFYHNLSNLELDILNLHKRIGTFCCHSGWTTCSIWRARFLCRATRQTVIAWNSVRFFGLHIGWMLPFGGCTTYTFGFTGLFSMFK